MVSAGAQSIPAMTGLGGYGGAGSEARSGSGAGAATATTNASATQRIGVSPSGEGAAMPSALAGGFEERHDLFHLVRVVEHAAGGAEALLPPDAEELGVGVGQLAAHPVQLGLLVG